MDCFMIRRVTPPAPMPLRIEGCNVRMTPSPDDAEMAAQAFMDLLAIGGIKACSHRNTNPARGTLEYYKQASRNIQAGHKAATCYALRFLSYSEQQFNSEVFPENIFKIEKELYELQGIAKSDDGLWKRWQRCLAMCEVRLMDSVNRNSDDSDSHTNIG